MSADHENTEELSSQSVLNIIEDWYHIPALLLVVVAMAAIRLQSYSEFIQGDGIFFSGNDAWYHYRSTIYTVRNWPSTMPFDPWTHYPYGTFVGQFGTLYDQIVATAALLIGLGSPSPELVAKTLLVTPAIAGALAVIPVYFIGHRLSGRVAGLFGAVVLLLLPGSFLSRTLAGVADHNAVEPLAMVLAVASFVVALQKASATLPVWEVVREELIKARELKTIEEPLKWSLLAGFFAGIYLWVWPPAVFLVGVVGLFAIVTIASDVVNQQTPEPTAFVVVVSMLVVGLMSLITLDEVGFNTTTLSLLQPVTALSVAGAAVFLSWLARAWEGTDLASSLYPAAVAGLGVVGIGILAILPFGLLDLITGNLLRIVGFSANAATRTIGEAQPFIAPSSLQRFGTGPSGRIAIEYGLTFFTGLAAAVWLHAQPLVRKGTTRAYGYIAGALGVIALIFLVPAILGGIESVTGIDEQVVGLLLISALIVGATFLADYDADKLFLIVWAVFITSMAFTQVRFNYYLALVVAVFNAYLFGEILQWLNLDRSIRDIGTDIDGYQVLAVVATILLILGPALAVPIAVGNTQTSPAWEAAQQNGPGSVVVWDESLSWMQENTPEEGNLGGAGNADQFEYYGTYERTEDFEYPDGTYGVQSWWDYGHWITVRGERIPNANPFQEGARPAANFLLAPNETQSEEVLTAQSTEGDQTRYVMVDWQMATPGSKFGAPTVFYDAEENVSREDFLRTMYRFDDQNQGRFVGTFSLRTDRFYNSTMTKLYYYHGSARQPSPIVVDWAPRQVETGSGEAVTLDSNPQGESFVRTFDNMSAAREYVAEDGTAQVGGLGSFPTQRVEALEHYRLVQVSDTSANRRILRTVGREAQIAGANPRATVPSNPAWVKTFERVPGATVEGSGAPENTTVTASTELRIPNTNSTFTYTQQAETDANGNFEMTLPYATTGYDEYGPDNGYTNVSVRATGPYTVSTPATLGNNGSIVSYQSNLSVPEGEVNGDGDGEINVELERNEQELTLGGGSSGGESTDGGSGDSGSSGGSDGETQSLREPAVAGDAARPA